MKTKEELVSAMENAIGGGNTGDIESAAADLESYRYRDVLECADMVVATAFGNIDGLSESYQLEALRCAAVVLRDAIRKLES